MKVIYENEIKALGALVEEFKETGMFVMFGEGAPDTLSDFCYTVSVNPIDGEIKPGQTFEIDGEPFTITAVGEEAPHTLAGLGHCTVNLNGNTVADLPGTICLEAKPMPDLHVGTKIRIIEN